ncbi:MAG: glycosyltransferase family 2 protein [Acidimicrobiia bacterium]|nr:glycosyltransferase family 2 protein [Acidimicrobiia bacterium]
MLEILTYTILAYVIVLELGVLLLAVGSWVSLRREQFTALHGRMFDMLSSVTTPPVSIIVPAYNEGLGIADAVRSLAMLRYPRVEIVIVNDGSTDDTLQKLHTAFNLFQVDMPVRQMINTEPIVATYRTKLPLPVVVVDKRNGGKGDAINAGINVSKYPYVLATDADIILDDECLLRMMRPVAEDRSRVIAVGGNVRPLNGSRVRRGKVTKVGLPARGIEMIQILEYLRSFLGARPCWSRINALLLISGALGLFQKAAVVEAGGFRRGHLGEDLELTMRLHRTARDAKRPYRIVYVPDAVAWTEVPATYEVLRKQRIRWHRGLTQVLREYASMMLRPRYGVVGMLAWPLFTLFEFVAPIVEFLGYVLVPVVLLTGHADPTRVVLLVVFAVALGVINTTLAMFLDERFGLYSRPGHGIRLLWFALREHVLIRQRTVWWRVRSLFWNGHAVWGDMPRTGVGRLTDDADAA